MRWLSADLNVAKGRGTGGAVAVAVVVASGGGDGGAAVSLLNRAASTSAGAGSSSVFINIVLCYACRGRVRNVRRSLTNTLCSVPANLAPRRSPLMVSRR